MLKADCHIEVRSPNGHETAQVIRYRKMNAVELYWKVTTREITLKYPEITYIRA